MQFEPPRQIVGYADKVRIKNIINNAHTTVEIPTKQNNKRTYIVFDTAPHDSVVKHIYKPTRQKWRERPIRNYLITEETNHRVNEITIKAELILNNKHIPPF